MRKLEVTITISVQLEMNPGEQTYRVEQEAWKQVYLASTRFQPPPNTQFTVAQVEEPSEVG